MNEPQKTFFPKTKRGLPHFDQSAEGGYQYVLEGKDAAKIRAEKRLNLCLGIIIICVLAVVYMSVTMKYKTYVVRVSEATGQVDVGGELKATNYKPHSMEIKHFLRQFIIDTRTVPADVVEYKNNWTEASHFLTSEAATKLNTFIKEDGQRSKLGRMTVSPKINSVQLQPNSKKVYQVRWSEESFGPGGDMTGKKVNYVALFAVGIDSSSKSEKELLVNPLGIKIADLSINKESGN